MHIVALRVLSVLCLAHTSFGLQDETYQFTMQLPGLDLTERDPAARPQLCASTRLPLPTAYVTGIKPLGRVDKLHHMMAYVCEEPGVISELDDTEAPAPHTQTFQAQDYYVCSGEGVEGLPQAATLCSGKHEDIYGWDNNITEYHFTGGTGVETGQGTRCPFLVVNVHYAATPEITDELGVTLLISNKFHHSLKTMKFHVDHFELPPLSTTNINCFERVHTYHSLHLHTYHVHTHDLGRNISVYRVRRGQWTTILRAMAKETNLPRMVRDGQGLDVEDDDLLVVQCQMTNTRNVTVIQGPNNWDEMCYINLHYFVNDDEQGVQTSNSLRSPENDKFGCSSQEKVAEDFNLLGLTFPP